MKGPAFGCRQSPLPSCRTWIEDHDEIDEFAGERCTCHSGNGQSRRCGLNEVALVIVDVRERGRDRAVGELAAGDLGGETAGVAVSQSAG